MHFTFHGIHELPANISGDLEKNIYMDQPPGFVAKEELELLYKLQCSLYGLKQSPRAWSGKFNTIIQQFGMK